MLPQVLAGLGAVSLASVGCVVWLERLQPLFVTLCVLALAYQGWLVWRRPRMARTNTMLVIFWASLGISLVVLMLVASLWLRYR